MSDLIERTMQIDTDEQMGRHYIPVTLDWEIQTKGKGSSFRIAQRTEDGNRWIIGDSYLHKMIEQMARDVNADSVAKDARIAELEVENAQARKTAEYWKAEHLAGNARIAELEAELTEWEKLKDPINLHVNLLRGVPCKLDRIQHLLHLAGATDYDDLKAANAKMRKCLEAIAEHHDELSIYPTMPDGEPAQDQYHTERRDFAREAMK